MVKTRELLDRITSIMDKDISRLEEAAEIALSSEDALTLTRYSKALMDMVEREDLELDKEMEELSRYTPEQLKELAINSLTQDDLKKITK